MAKTAMFNGKAYSYDGSAQALASLAIQIANETGKELTFVFGELMGNKQIKEKGERSVMTIDEVMESVPLAGTVWSDIHISSVNDKINLTDENGVDLVVDGVFNTFGLDADTSFALIRQGVVDCLDRLLSDLYAQISETNDACKLYRDAQKRDERLVSFTASKWGNVFYGLDYADWSQTPKSSDAVYQVDKKLVAASTDVFTFLSDFRDSVLRYRNLVAAI